MLNATHKSACHWNYRKALTFAFVIAGMGTLVVVFCLLATHIDGGKVPMASRALSVSASPPKDVQWASMSKTSVQNDVITPSLDYVIQRGFPTYSNLNVTGDLVDPGARAVVLAVRSVWEPLQNGTGTILFHELGEDKQAHLDGAFSIECGFSKPNMYSETLHYEWDEAHAPSSYAKDDQ